MDEGIPLPSVEAAARKAESIMMPLLSPLKEIVQHEEENARRYFSIVTEAQAKVDGCGSSLSGAGRPRPNRNYRDLNSGLAGDSNNSNDPTSPEQLLKELAQKKEDLVSAGKLLDKARLELANFKSDNSPFTYQEFVDFAHEQLKPGFDYYRGKYLTRGGELSSFRSAMRGASVFDVLELQHMQEGLAGMLIRDISYFGFPSIDEEVLHQMTRELPALIELCKLPFDWSKVDGAAKYDSTVASGLSSSSSRVCSPTFRSPERFECTEENAKGLWKKDPVEKARRIWAWWNQMNTDGRCDTFNLVRRQLALVQPSSASAERGFSRLKLILDQIGDSAMKDTILTRLMISVNRDQFPPNAAGE